MKVKGWEKVFHAKCEQQKLGVATLVSGKIDFEIKGMPRDKDGRYIMIKGSIQEEPITIIIYMHPT